MQWRDVPISSDHLGELSRSTLPNISQVFMARVRMSREAFERKLYVVRRMAEKEVASWNEEGVEDFYIASMSSRTIVYKGLLTGDAVVDVLQGFQR